jgi:hypothetical protein
MCNFDVYACGGNLTSCNEAAEGILIAAKHKKALPFNTNNITFTNASADAATTIVVHLLRKS